MYIIKFVGNIKIYKTYSIHKVHSGSFKGVRAIQNFLTLKKAPKMRFKHYMYRTTFVGNFKIYKTYSIPKVHLGSFKGVRAIQNFLTHKKAP